MILRATDDHSKSLLRDTISISSFPTECLEVKHESLHMGCWIRKSTHLSTRYWELATNLEVKLSGIVHCRARYCNSDWPGSKSRSGPIFSPFTRTELIKRWPAKDRGVNGTRESVVSGSNGGAQQQCDCFISSLQHCRDEGPLIPVKRDRRLAKLALLSTW